jgi:hypothetical protein
LSVWGDKRRRNMRNRKKGKNTDISEEMEMLYGNNGKKLLEEKSVEMGKSLSLTFICDFEILFVMVLF